MPAQPSVPGQDASRRNRLLSALPTPEFEVLQPSLLPVALDRGAVLAESGEAMRHVYFPHQGVLSMVLLMADGAAVEGATIGPEGLAGLGVALEQPFAQARYLVQVSGDASRMEAGAFRHAMACNIRLRHIVSRYIDGFVTQLLWSTACNARHGLEQRAARWLLMARDRATGDRLDLTQESLAEMLGVRRASIGTILARFREAGLLAQGRGRMRVLDRGGLEARSCECYRAIRRRLDGTIDHAV